MALRISLAAALITLTATFAPTARAEDGKRLDPNTAAGQVYGGDHLKGLQDGATLVYDYRMDGRILEKPFEDEVILAFKRADEAADHRYDVTATIFPKTRSQTLGPIVASAFNPLLLIYFQRDVNQMGNGTGGSKHYFRNVIRHSMATPGEFDEKNVTMEVAGKTIEVRQISFSPFKTDEHEAQMKSFSDKTYTVTLSDGVPGGIVELSASTPADPGTAGDGPLLRETYRFREMRR